ncbi:TfoX/Sxy family protein [Oceanomicrobium pacificus]|uniref:TfoX N-terminal domain-containing protein n=1 Tax=Oceanomicrobium pacificus TaxID=2692916 RepID=A0A6B0TNU4_9RHOB|nr:TfoX/Sxy family protein [Oceanomicrobium pacificus]MXU66280.1 hypothetical protein [Oceanomicrobium pacificus]
MAYDEALAQNLREALDGHPGISEKKMFGGLCFLLRGNMLCGVHKDGGMARVGKANEAQALEIEGVSPLSFTGRPMGGMVDIDADLIADASRRGAVLDLCFDFVGGLPPK